MTHNIYGSCIDGIHTDTSRTMQGAKCYATRAGLDNISIRYADSYIVSILLMKDCDGKWIPFEESGYETIKKHNR